MGLLSAILSPLLGLPKPAPEPAPPVKPERAVPTVVDAVRELSKLDPAAALVIAHRPSSVWEVRKTRLAYEVTIMEVPVRRAIRPDEAGYVKGAYNIMEDPAQPLRVLIRVGSLQEVRFGEMSPPPKSAVMMSVSDLLEELRKVPGDLLLVASDYDNPRYTEPARWIKAGQFTPLRPLQRGEPGYVEGASNVTEDSERAFFYVDDMEYSRYNFE